MLTDINMNRMNGLDFIQRAKERVSDVKFVIISGYDDFSYAKRAITLGVNDYIVKPIDEDELKTVLLNVKNRINTEQLLKKKIENLNETIITNEESLKKNYLSKLIAGNLPQSGDDVNKHIEHYGLKIRTADFSVVYITINEFFIEKWEMEDKSLWTFAVENVAVEILGNSAEVVIEDVGKLYAVVSKLNSEKELVERCERIKMFIQDYLPFSACISIGGLKSDLKDISDSYHEANFVNSATGIFDDNIVVTYSDITESTPTLTLSQQFDNDAFLMNLHAENTDSCIRIIHEVFLNLSNSKKSVRVAYISFLEILLCCLEYINEQPTIISGELNGMYNVAYEKTAAAESLFTMRETVEQLVKSMHVKVGEYQKDNISQIVLDAVDYINDNYSDPYLNIEMLAQKTYTSYGHLCFIFKREMGQTINDYIMEFRLTRARKLLLSDSISVAGVAQSVGYLNANYFSKMFKKKYNVLPSELKK